MYFCFPAAVLPQIHTPGGKVHLPFLLLSSHTPACFEYFFFLLLLCLLVWGFGGVGGGLGFFARFRESQEGRKLQPFIHSFTGGCRTLGSLPRGAPAGTLGAAPARSRRAARAPLLQCRLRFTPSQLCLPKSGTMQAAR